MESLENLLRDFEQARKDYEQVIRALPRVMGVIAVKEVKGNFAAQGYRGPNGFQAWKERKESTNKNYDRGKTVNSKGVQSKYRTGKNSVYKGSVYSSKNPILEQTLALRDSVHYSVSGGFVFIGVNLNIVPYAKCHNEGIYPQPKRQYMPKASEGANPRMIAEIVKKMDFETNKAMAKFRR